MAEAWYWLLCLMLSAFVVLDGLNIGVGALHAFIARTPAERRTAVAALGPMWSWHEVWLVASGGVLFVAFPAVLATAFSGYYLALFLVLWSLLLRGVALEVGGHLDDAMWRSFFDVVLTLASLVLALALGAAVGNVVRGVPLDDTGRFSLAFFTDFQPRGHVGLLDWYTLSTALFATVALMGHGAVWLWLKTQHGPLHDRARSAAARLWSAAGAVLVVVTAETWSVRPALFEAMAQRPLGWLFVAVALAGGAAVGTGLRGGAEGRALVGSAAILLGLLGAAAAGLFPVMLYDTLNPHRSLTALNSASSPYGLSTAMVWWPCALVLVAVSFGVIARQLPRKV